MVSESFAYVEGDPWFEKGHGGVRQETPSVFDNDQSSYTRERRQLDWEELQKAAVERLSKKSAQYMVVLPVLDEEREELLKADVLDLRSRDAKVDLMERLLASSDEQGVALVERIRKRMDAVQVDLNTVQVRWRNLQVEANVVLGKRALPTLTNAAIATGKAFLKPFGIGTRVEKRVLLKNLSGVLMAGSFTLMLGLPGSGKTTLLKALAGQLQKDKKLKVSGSVDYNGVAVSEGAWVLEHCSAYVEQVDNHIPELTVRETINFAAATRSQAAQTLDIIEEIERREREMGIKPDPEIVAAVTAMAMQGKDNLRTLLLLKHLGLDVCADTLVGNEMLRGISGGQKKRVTSGEMLAGGVRALFMDEISTGLDSATTLQIVKMLKKRAKIFWGTILISLLQPPPETVAQFDDLLVLADGYIIYQGPVQDVLQFAESVGLKCPPTLPTQEFLQEITATKEQKKYWRLTDRPYQYITPEEFSHAFKKTEAAKKIQKQLDSPYEENEGNLMSPVLISKPYIQPIRSIFWLLMDREFRLLQRKKAFLIFRLGQMVVTSLIMGSVFFQIPHNTVADGSNTMGVLFFSLMNMMFAGAPEMAITIGRLPVLYKQRDYKFYPAWCFVIPDFLLRLPQGLIETLVFTNILYWMVGLSPRFEEYMFFMALLFVTHQVSMTMFRALAAVCRNMVVAQGVGSFWILIMQLNSGFANAAGDIPPWWIWGYWISPTAWAVRSVSINEMLSPSWSLPWSVDPSHTVGEASLMARDFHTDVFWKWLGLLVMIGFIILNVLLQIGALTFLQPFRGTVTVFDDGEQEEKKDTKQKEDHHVKETAVPISKASCNLDGIPFRPVSLTFHSVHYWVPKPKGEKGEELELLKGITGAFRPEVLTALMGESGAGKTTLMDVLAGRKTGGRIEGDIRVNGFPKHQVSFNRVMGYVEQTDIHSPQTTVAEALMFSGRLRVSGTVTDKQLKGLVEQVMVVVELTGLRDGLVGLPGTSGLSVEQRKRLTIAVELVGNPSIVFMDEPTSGLDARAAAIVMRAVRNTVGTGRSVVATIHQPSRDIFMAFHELLLLKRGGETIYFGPIGEGAADLVGYFESAAPVSRYSPDVNPANWMLEVTNNNQSSKMGVNFADIYRNSGLSRQADELVARYAEPESGSQALESLPSQKLSFWGQYLTLQKKFVILYWRTPQYNFFRMVLTMLIAFVFATMYWNTAHDMSEMKDVLNVLGSALTSTLFLGNSNYGTVMPVVTTDRAVFYRERAAGLYSVWPYLLSQTIIELPYCVVQAALYGTITYWCMGYEADLVKYLWFNIIIYVVLLMWTFLGMLLAAATPALQVAQVIGGTMMPLWNLFSGFLIPQPMMPHWISWVCYLSPTYWTLYALLTTQFGDRYDITVTAPSGSQMPLPHYLEAVYGFRYSWRFGVLFMLVGFAVLFRVACGLAYQKLNFQKR